MCHSIIPTHSFFFNQFFRRQSPPSSAPAVLTSRDHVISNSGSDLTTGQVGKSGRSGIIINENVPQGALAYGGSAAAPVRNEDFQVPKSLCVACEKFPWTPVPGSDNKPIAPPGGLQLANQPSVAYVAVADRNRRPFAINFDSSQTHNVVNSQLPTVSNVNVILSGRMEEIKHAHIWLPFPILVLFLTPEFFILAVWSYHVNLSWE